MEHTFLIEPGIWRLSGHYILGDRRSVELAGTTVLTNNEDYWFSITTNLKIAHRHAENITIKSTGRIDPETNKCNFIWQHSQLGRMEGEGWIGKRSIVQRYWVVGDPQKRHGFETYHQISNNQYYLSSTFLGLQRLSSIMEVVLDRHQSIAD